MTQNNIVNRYLNINHAFYDTQDPLSLHIIFAWTQYTLHYLHDAHLHWRRPRRRSHRDDDGQNKSRLALLVGFCKYRCAKQRTTFCKVIHVRVLVRFLAASWWLRWRFSPVVYLSCHSLQQQVFVFDKVDDDDFSYYAMLNISLKFFFLLDIIM